MDSYYPPYELIDHTQYNVREFKKVTAMFADTNLKIIYIRLFSDGRCYILKDNMQYIIEFGKFIHVVKEVARPFGQDITSSSDGDWHVFIWSSTPRGVLERWHWLHDVWNGATIFRISPHGYTNVYAIASTRDNTEAMESLRREKDALLEIVRHLDLNMSHVYTSIDAYKGSMFSFGGGVCINRSALLANQKIVQMILARIRAGANDLTAQQAAVFCEIGKGSSAKDTSRALGYSESTVRWYENILKLDVLTFACSKVSVGIV